MMGTNMEIHQIIQTGQAGSSLHSVTDLERLKMQKTGLEKAMRHVGVLGMPINDLRPRDSLGSQLEGDRQRAVLGRDAAGACAHSPALSSLSPLLSSVSLRKVEPVLRRWVVTHVLLLVVPCIVTLDHRVGHRGLALAPLSRGGYWGGEKKGLGDLGRGLGSLERWEEKPSSSLDSLAEVLAVAPEVNVFTDDFLSPGSLLQVNIHFFPFSSFFPASFKPKFLILNTIDSWGQVFLGLQGLCCPCRMFNSIPGLSYLPDVHSTPTTLWKWNVSNSQRQKVEWWLLGLEGVGKGGVTV